MTTRGQIPQISQKFLNLSVQNIVTYKDKFFLV